MNAPNPNRESLPRGEILVGDAREQLAKLPAASVDMVVTSPPYFRLRDYQVDGQLGLEGHVDDWVSGLRAVMTEVARVLVPTGTVWLNLGDTYSTHISQGAAKKSLLLGPERLARALLTDGWQVRNKIVWAKTNPMPTSIRDRFACTWEVVYLLTRTRYYFFDLDAVRVPHRSAAPKPRRQPVPGVLPDAWRGPNGDNAGGLCDLKRRGMVGHPLGKNPGDVWQMSTAGFRGGHYAAFPLALAERAIRAGCPLRRCARCHVPWTKSAAGKGCGCDAGTEPGVVLDPFLGAGTTAVVAESLGRDWVGIELNPEFAELARRRITDAREHRATRAHN